MTAQPKHPPIELALDLSLFAYTDSDPLPGEILVDHKLRMVKDIDAQLEPLGWSTVWLGLSDDRASMLYVATNDVNDAIAIRGTDWSFWLNWIHDLAVLTQVPFPIPGTTDLMLARGTAIATETLLTLEDQGLKVHEVIDQPAYITGHSLGGCLVAPLATSLAVHISPERLIPIAFAGPSPGNQAFANYYNQLFPNHQHFANSQDVIPHSWANLEHLRTFYDPVPKPTPALLKVLERAIQAVQQDYTQPRTIVLPGEVIPPGEEDRHPFYSQLAWQHAIDTYRTLLNLPSTAF